jgi:NTE family protein
MPPPVVSPVVRIPSDSRRRGPDPGIALCLSGGGYRAMLFHLGALWRLNEWGYLPRLARISSVSGGSIVAAQLGARWSELGFDAAGVAVEFRDRIVEPVRNLGGRTIDSGAIVGGLATPGSISRHLARAYRRHLLGKATLQDLPRDGEGPRFIINAANLQSGALWRFSRPYARDYKVGSIPSPAVPLAVAVAASSAFPPVLGPMRLRFKNRDFQPGSGEQLQRPPYTTRPVLADGGVYDNLGLETAWKRCRTVLVSDGGAPIEPEPGAMGLAKGWRWRDWASQSMRVMHVIDSQVRNLRKRAVIAGFQADTRDPAHRDGCYWGIGTNIARYGLPSSLPCPRDETLVLASLATRLAALDADTQRRLINWGYAACDAAMRRWVEPSLPAGEYPYPTVGIGPSTMRAGP